MPKQRNLDACCGNCPYWDDLSDDDNFSIGNGFCRRKCPSFFDRDAIPERSAYSYDWPVTDTSDYCGEHPDFFIEPQSRWDMIANELYGLGFHLVTIPGIVNDLKSRMAEKPEPENIS